MKKIIFILLAAAVYSVLAYGIDKEVQEIGVDSNGKKLYMEIERENGKIVRETETDEKGNKLKIYNFTQYDKDGYPTVAEIYDNDGKYILKLKINYTEDGKIGFHMDVNGEKSESEVQDVKKKIETIYFDERYIKKRNEALKLKSADIRKNIDKNKISMADTSIGNVKTDLQVSQNILQDSVIAEIITDSMREYSGADIAFYNSGSIKGTLNKGVIGFQDVKNLTDGENLFLMEVLF